MGTDGVGAAIRAYLLGGLSSEEQEALEQRLMTEKEAFDQLACLEHELIDAYVRDELDPEESERFQKYFLSTPERHRQLAFARSLLARVDREEPVLAVAATVEDDNRLPPEEPSQVISSPPRPRRFPSFATSPLWAPAAAAALLVMLIGGPVLVVANNNLERELDREVAVQASLEEELRLEQARRAELQPQLVVARGEIDEARARIVVLEDEKRRLLAEIGSGTSPLRTAASFVATLWVRAGSLRDPGEETARLVLPAESNLARLELDVGIDDFDSYSAVLEHPERGELMSQAGLRAVNLARGVAVAVSVPAETLDPGDYFIRLYGEMAGRERELIDRYYFRVLDD